jgi:predicted ATP-binding protein involved in virulence
LQAATQRNGDLTGYESWWDASLDTKNLQLWVISKCLERFERVSSEAGISFDLVTDDELAVVNMALHEVMSDIKGLRYSITKKRLIVEWQSSPATLFDNLSDGQRSIICLVADIARRMCLLNPQLEMEVIKQTPGIVLIDELDMHLHPQWQRILTNGLQKAFPKVQFIVASHSPQVLGELKPEQIILLRPEGTAHPQVSYGLTSSQVLEEIMGASERSGDVKKRLSELGSTLARNELPAARQHIADLEIEAPGIPELTGAKALLKRKEILGR